MKKFKLFALTALFCAMGTNAFAQGTDLADGYLRYKVTAGKAEITGFVANQEVAAINIPAQVTDPVTPTTKYDVTSVGADAFKGKTIITSVTIADTKVATLANGAFENCTNLTTVTIGKAVTTINAAFKGCSKLATVTFPASSNTTNIAASAFEGTAIETLDLTNTKVATLERLFTSGTTKNKKLETIKLPLSLQTINANAFDNCLTLANIEFATGSGAKDVTINASAFANTIFLEELELPARVAVLADDALKDSEIKTLTINSHATAGTQQINAIGGDNLESIIVKGDFKGAFGDGTKTVSTTITSLTFKGKVAGDAIKVASLAGATKLATITFEGNLAAAAVAAGALGTGAAPYAGSGLGAGKMLNIIYSPAESDDAKVVSIAVNAISTTPGAAIAKLSTSTWYKTWLSTPSNIPNQFEVSAAAVTKVLKVANNGEGKYFYAEFTAPANYKIAAAQNGGKVMVYGGYIDAIENAAAKTVAITAYMDQLHIIGGYYYIPNGESVVVKSTTADDVVAEADEVGTESSLHFDGFTNDLNKIQAVAAGTTYAKEVQLANPGDDVYFLLPFETYGYRWNTLKPTTEVHEGQLYMLYTLPAGFSYAAARLNVVWLDGSEDNQTTAIQSVKNVAEDGAIYNLAGQQVDANYKGVVIKNGKKMIQK